MELRLNCSVKYQTSLILWYLKCLQFLEMNSLMINNNFTPEKTLRQLKISKKNVTEQNGKSTKTEEL